MGKGLGYFLSEDSYYLTSVSSRLGIVAKVAGDFLVFLPI